MRNISKRVLTCFVVLTLAVLAGAATAEPRAELDQLAWLIGGWKREARSGAIHESWTRLGDRVFEGRSWRTAEPGSAAMPLEDILLAEMGGEVFYIPKVAENPYPVAFRLVKLEGRSAVFENPQHDFPQRITYELREDDTLLAAIEGPGGAEGAPQRIEFRFVRE